MSEIRVDNITDEAGTGRPTFINGVQASNINGGQVGGRRNLIINGAMQVAQRGTSETGASTSGYYTVDRWLFNFSGGSLDIEQSSDAPENFSNSLRATVDSTFSPRSDTSDQNYIGTRLESQNVYHLGYGTPSPRVSVLSFWVKSNDTGNRVLWLFNNNSSQFRHYAQVFSVAQVNTWEKFEFLIPTDTVSFDNDNNTGLDIRIILASAFTGGIPDSEWVNLSDNRHAGIDNFFDTVGNEFYLTGVQLEVGDTATEFEHRSYGDELALCQRYYYQLGPSLPRFGVLGEAIASTVAQFNYVLPVKMRSSPSLLTDSNTSDYELYRGNQNENATNISFSSFLNPDGDCWGCRVNLTVNSGFISAGQVTQGSGRNNAFFGFDAEL